MRAFAVIGPSQSGKSTLIEGLAALDGRKHRSLTLMGGSRITEFEFMGDQWAALDVPGGHGKVPVGPCHLSGSEAAGWRVEDLAGRRYAYPPPPQD